MALTAPFTSWFVIPETAQRIRNLEIPGSMRRIVPE